MSTKLEILGFACGVAGVYFTLGLGLALLVAGVLFWFLAQGLEG